MSREPVGAQDGKLLASTRLAIAPRLSGMMQVFRPLGASVRSGTASTMPLPLRQASVLLEIARRHVRDFADPGLDDDMLDDATRGGNVLDATDLLRRYLQLTIEHVQVRAGLAAAKHSDRLAQILGEPIKVMVELPQLPFEEKAVVPLAETLAPDRDARAFVERIEFLLACIERDRFPSTDGGERPS